jgi:hypothetical protein
MAAIALGRRQLLSVLGGAAAFLAFLAVAAWFRSGPSRPLRTFGPLIVFCALGALAYRRVPPRPRAARARRWLGWPRRGRRSARRR